MASSGFCTTASRPSLRLAGRQSSVLRASNGPVQVAERVLRYPGGIERRLSYPVSQASQERAPAKADVASKDGAAEARAWISAWRTRSLEQCITAEPVEDNAAEARAWIEAWRSKPVDSAKPSGGEDNAAEARAWIEAWRSKSVDSAKSSGIAAADVFGSWLQEEGVITFTAEQLNSVCLKSALDALESKC